MKVILCYLKNLLLQLFEAIKAILTFCLGLGILLGIAGLIAVAIGKVIDAGTGTSSPWDVVISVGTLVLVVSTMLFLVLSGTWQFFTRVWRDTKKETRK